MDKELIYLVPYDFSEVGDSALIHALNLADSTNGVVHLLHIVGAEDDIPWAQNEFHKALDRLGLNDNPRIEIRVFVGDIFKDIASVAEREKAKWIVMGTHGAKGLQKLFGSYAIKVILSSTIPFIVVQKKLHPDPVKKIVMPMTLTKESIRSLKFATDLAEHYKAEIHVVGAHQKDEFLEHKVKNNLIVSKKYLAGHGIDFHVHRLEGKKSLASEVMAFGKSIDADLYALGYFPESVFPQFDTFAQEMITNKDQLPVLIVNAETVNQISGQFSFL